MENVKKKKEKTIKDIMKNVIKEIHPFLGECLIFKLENNINNKAITVIISEQNNQTLFIKISGSTQILSAVEEEYYNLLSEPSKISLSAQGGPFTKVEAEEFINKPYMKEAVELRRLDDEAKILNKKTPNLLHFKHYLEKSLKN